ncbi:methyl-accepting chemotaxis protein [Nitrincola sp. MINF-07-Sa-05]|uniref:methyl-accepting chemotaxis protein n=1 Tax=Nitrincola salilacus TaxID=3400273 RepID=UPI003917BA3C
MTIYKRLMLSFMLMATMTLVLGGILSYQLYRLGNNTHDMFEKTLSAVDTARGAWEHFRNAKDYANSVQLMIELHESAEVANIFSKRYELMLDNLSDLENNQLTSEITGSVSNSKKLAGQWRDAQLKIITGNGLSNLPSASYLQGLESALEAAMGDIVTITISHANEQQLTAKETVHDVIGMALAMLIGVSILAFTLAVFISNSLTRPIKQLHTFMTELAAGRGDLTKRMEEKGHDELGLVAQKFNQFIETLQQMVSKTLDSAKGLHNATEHFQQKTTDLSRNVEQQKNTIASTTQTAAQLRNSTNTIVGETQTASNVAQRVSEQASDSQRIVLQSMESIESLASSMTTTSGYINALTESSTRISQFVAVIKEITEQTNLLALNAAIEAARAGEYGRGFAVVAGEVRALAAKTQASTVDIQTIIESIQEDVADSVRNMNINSEQAKKCVEQNASVRDALALMAESVAEINDMNLRILKATEQQQNSTNEVDMDMQKVHSIAEQSDTDMAEMQDQSLALQKTAKSLTELVQGFAI